MNKQYPADYTGPKAGISNDEEWRNVTEYQAFKHIKFEDWSYSDFDCWLGVRDKWHFDQGRDEAFAKSLLKSFQDDVESETTESFTVSTNTWYFTPTSENINEN